MTSVKAEMMREKQSIVRSLQRGLQLINAVGEQGPAHAKQLARNTGMPLATAYHLLRTLLHDGYVARLEDGTYVLGSALDAARSERATGWRAFDVMDVDRCAI